jgi:ribose transport system substrate-binding protein
MARGRSNLAQSVVRACSILSTFRYEGELLRLRDFVQRTSYSKSTVHRLLQSLEAGKLVERVGNEYYRSRMKPAGPVAVRIGFATRGSQSPFSGVLTESVQRAAAQAGVDLVTVENRYSPRLSLRNVDLLIREGVDLVIEYQSHERLAPLISSRFLDAGIPVIAIEIPHPGATFFGANNYQAGLIGGRGLAQWIHEHWDGKAAEVILMGEGIAGSLPRLRLTGALVGMRESVPQIDAARLRELDGRGRLDRAFELMRRHLHLAPPRRTVVVASNDPMALGVLRAFEESGRIDYCAVMGQNASPEARQELRRPGTGLVGTVAYFPELYGDHIIRLALSILSGKPTPTAVYTNHALLTSANVDKIYPQDGSMRNTPLAGAPIQMAGRQA